MPLNGIRFTEDVPIQDSKQHRWRDFDDKFRFYLQGVFQLSLPIFSTKMKKKNCCMIMLNIDFLSIYDVMYEDNDYCDAGGAMWDPISDDNLSSLDPFTANQTNQKINKNGNEMI